jgi:hypothetical protein
MTTEPPGDADTARAKAAAAVRADPATAQAWALVSIADSLAAIRRDVHAMKQAGRRG